MSNHGFSNHPLYPTWLNVIQRCYASNNQRYKDYGGRGIEVYGPWKENPRNFISWVEQKLGPKPEGFSLDRIDNNGHYVPGNLRWADKKLQAKNRRRVRALSLQDEKILEMFKMPLVFEYRENSGREHNVRQGRCYNQKNRRCFRQVEGCGPG